MSNTFGNIFRLTTFGESHGKAIGGIVDGCPAGILLDEALIQSELDRRRPGQSVITTARNEKDKVEFLSGIFDGRTTGTPIAFVVMNADQHSSDYDSLKDIYRPSHADFTYQTKYGLRDHRGGGRTSARETIARVVGGAIAKLVLQQWGVLVAAYTSQVGHIKLAGTYKDYDLSQTESNIVRCPDAATAKAMEDYILQIKKENDTIGGVVSCVIQNVPVGLGEPVFGKAHAVLGAAMMSINAAKGFDYGMGFDGVALKGSEQNDAFYNDNGVIRTRTNNSGGIQGGISNGEDIYFRILFKPVATILTAQNTVDKAGNEAIMQAKGRHDPCVLPRAVPIVESMAAMTMLDLYLQHNAYKK
jgi:chorismate synthase